MSDTTQRRPPTQRPFTEPLPMCPFAPKPRNVDASNHFISASSHTFYERFWSWIFEIFPQATIVLPLEVETRLLRRFPRLPHVRTMFYEAWKHGNFTTSKEAEVLRLTSAVHLLLVLAYAFVSVFCLVTAILVCCSCGCLFSLFSGTGCNSRAYFQRYTITHTQKYTETPDPSEVEGRWKGWCADWRYATVAERQVRCTLVPRNLIPCVVVSFLILKARVLPPLSGRREVFPGFQVTWYGLRWYDYDDWWTPAAN